MNRLDLDDIRSTFVRALQSAFDRHSALGEQGLQEICKNQFGETALRMDVEAEQAVLASLFKDGLPVRVLSEEHGTVDIGRPEFLAVLDGIDGTALYKKERNKGKYGTMLGLYQGIDPLYSDYLIGGIMQHSTEKMLLGVRGRGAVCISGDHEQPIRIAKDSAFDLQARIYIDEYFEINRKTFSEPLSGFNTAYREASCLYYGEIAEGRAAFVLECTRKGNLEIAAAYGLIREAGGVTVDWEGFDIGEQKYLEFGQRENIPVITAATRELAHQMLAFLHSN